MTARAGHRCIAQIELIQRIENKEISVETGFKEAGSARCGLLRPVATIEGSNGTRLGHGFRCCWRRPCSCACPTWPLITGPKTQRASLSLRSLMELPTSTSFTVEGFITQRYTDKKSTRVHDRGANMAFERT